jgi:general stress protein CsbA
MKKLILRVAGLFFPKVFGVFFKNRTSMKYSATMMLVSYLTEFILNRFHNQPKPVLAVARPKSIYNKR